MHQKEYGLQVCFIIWRDFPTCTEMKIYSCRLLLDLCVLSKREITTMFWQGNCIFSIWIRISPQLPMLLPPLLNYCSAPWGWKTTHCRKQRTHPPGDSAVFFTEHKLHLYCKICLTPSHFSGWCSDLHSLDQVHHRNTRSHFLSPFLFSTKMIIKVILDGFFCMGITAKIRPIGWIIYSKMNHK